MTAHALFGEDGLHLLVEIDIRRRLLGVQLRRGSEEHESGDNSGSHITGLLLLSPLSYRFSVLRGVSRLIHYGLFGCAAKKDHMSSVVGTPVRAWPRVAAALDCVERYG